MWRVRQSSCFAPSLAGGLLLALVSAPVWADPESDYKRGHQLFSEDNMTDALVYLNRAAQDGSIPAMSLLGKLHDGAENDAIAVEWFRKAAQAGDPKGQIGLGEMYAKGEGVTQDHAEAVKWFTKAADQNDPQAMSILSQFHRRGIGIPADPGKAMELLTKAAVMGYTPAMRELIDIYTRGSQEIDPDPSEAKKWQEELSRIQAASSGKKP